MGLLHTFDQATVDNRATRVLLVGDFPPPHGGVATHVEVLFRALREHGAECAVLDIGKGQIPADGVIPAGSMTRFAGLLTRHAARGFRIHVHTSGANPKSWALAAACATAGRGRAMITFHSGLGPAWLAQSAARRTLARRIANQFATVIAVSDDIRKALIEAGVDAQRIEVLPAFSPSFLEPGQPPDGFAALRAEAAPLYSAMIAPTPIYGLQTLLQAFAKVHDTNPKARLAVYGIGSAELNAEGVQGFGELQRDSALAVMAQSDIFLRPTLADGDSVSVREALALGRAVIASSVGTRPPEAQLVPPGDADALAAAMLEARPVRTIARPVDCIDRLLQLYGVAEAPCVASLAS